MATASTSHDGTPYFLQGGGAMGERMRAFDWASHPMGPPAQWPQALGMALALCLNSSFPTAVYWGPELFILYNDAWAEIPAEKHPWILGKPAREGWSDIWDVVEPQFRQVMETGAGIAVYENLLPMVRGGQARETWWNYSFTPIRHADQSIGGIFNHGHEITDIVQARRVRQAEVQRWRELFHQAPVGVALLRGPEHVLEFANEAYLRHVGGRAVVGLPLRQAVPEITGQGFLELLDRVSRTGEPYVGAGMKVRLQNSPEAPAEERVIDFVYQPVRTESEAVDGILVLVTDMTERARAEAALRISNWQLGEERARLTALVEAEQRSQQALRRLADNLEAHVTSRTAELSRALQAQQAAADRLRATFETRLVGQGFLDVDGKVRDANTVSLEIIGCRLEEVTGRPFWETPWFSTTPGAPEQVRAGIEAAARGENVQRQMELVLPSGRQRCHVVLRPARDAKGRVIGLVAEAVLLRAA